MNGFLSIPPERDTPKQGCVCAGCSVHSSNDYSLKISLNHRLILVNSCMVFFVYYISIVYYTTVYL